MVANSRCVEDFDACYDWLTELSNDLEDLDRGVVPPALRCEVQNKVLSTNVWFLRVRAVAIVEALHLAGMKYSPAAARVISAMQLEGVLERDVLGWRTEFAKGRVKHRDAAVRYKNTMRFLRRWNRVALGTWAQEILRGVEEMPIFDDEEEIFDVVGPIPVFEDD